jgi:hypothetical protein
MDVRDYFLLGLIHLPPEAIEIIIQTTAAHEYRTAAYFHHCLA